MSKKMSRLYTLFSFLLVAAMLLAACKPAATATPAPTTAAATKAPEPTALPAVELLWYLDGVTPKDADLVMAALNELPQLKVINVKVKITWFDWGAYDQKTQLMFAGGEPCDLIFTSSWANNYINGAINGNYIALDDLLPKYAPKIWKEVSKTAWNMSRVQGKIYAIPNQQLWYDAWGWQMVKTVADKYGVKVEDINKFEDLTPVMAKILADNPNMKNQIVQGGGPFVPGTFGYDGTSTGVIKQGDTTRKIVNVQEVPEYLQRLKLWRSWVLAGYAPQDVVDYATADAARKQGLFPLKLHVEKPGVSAEDKATYGVGDWIFKPLQKPTLGYVLPTMTGVCATSKNPERSLMFFDLMFSDEVVFNLVANGIEGKHWVWVDKAKKVIGFPEGLDSKNSGYFVNTDWMIGNVFISYYKDLNQVGAWDETRKGNQNAVLPMAGPFIFDPKPVQAELSALQTVNKTFADVVQNGLVDPEDPAKGLPAWIKAQKDAGLDKVIAEEQKQLDAFIAANPDIYK
jgi:putative aldouronate transport system substrate-binding protein